MTGAGACCRAVSELVPRRLRLAVGSGIEKVNVGTEMNVQWVAQCKATFEKGKVNDSVRNFLVPANNAVTNVLVEKMQLFR